MNRGQPKYTIKLITNLKYKAWALGSQSPLHGLSRIYDHNDTWQQGPPLLIQPNVLVASQGETYRIRSDPP